MLGCWWKQTLCSLSLRFMCPDPKKIHLGFSRMKTDSSITPWFKYYTLIQLTWSKQQYTLWRKKAMVNKFAHYTPCVSWGLVSIAGSSGWSAFNGYIYAGSQNRFDQGAAFFSEISWESDAKPPGISIEGTEEWIKRISWTNKNRVMIMCATNDRGENPLRDSCALGAHHLPVRDVLWEPTTTHRCGMSPGITFGEAFVNIFLQYWSPWDLKLDAKKRLTISNCVPQLVAKRQRFLLSKLLWMQVSSKRLF